MRATRILPLLMLVLLAATPAGSKEPACTYDIGACLMMFEGLKRRPWLGVTIETDTVNHHSVIKSVIPGSPADRAGLEPGDRVTRIDGMVPRQWFIATKASWEPGGDEGGELAVLRDGRALKLDLRYERIPDDQFARIVGVHMVEGHLAHMPKEKSD